MRPRILHYIGYHTIEQGNDTFALLLTIGDARKRWSAENRNNNTEELRTNGWCPQYLISFSLALCVLHGVCEQEELCVLQLLLPLAVSNKKAKHFPTYNHRLSLFRALDKSIDTHLWTILCNFSHRCPREHDPCFSGWWWWRHGTRTLWSAGYTILFFFYKMFVPISVAVLWIVIIWSGVCVSYANSQSAFWSANNCIVKLCAALQNILLDSRDGSSQAQLFRGGGGGGRGRVEPQSNCPGST